MKFLTRKNTFNQFHAGRLLAGIIIIFLFILFTPLVSSAQDDTQKKESQLLTPPNPNGLTEIFVDVGISEIFAINEREETYDVDAYMLLVWFDDRLVFDPDEFGYEKKTYQGEAAVEILKTDIWSPDINIVDARSSRDRINTSVTVYFDGAVEYEERFSVKIEQGFDLYQFPFDEQDISFTIEPFAYGSDEVAFFPITDPIVDEWETEEWEVLYHPLEVDSGEATGYSSATASLTLIRFPTFYITNFIIPLLLIVTLSWAVFWMDHQTNLSERMSVSFTSVLTVVAFDFLSSDTLPRLEYPTILDQVLTISYVFLALTIVENVVSASLVRRGSEETAERVDTISRWLFPLAYFATIGIMISLTLSGP
ncbi:MAG: hypothetical protein AB8G95_25795 [Anaerolineae bacterium]